MGWRHRQPMAAQQPPGRVPAGRLAGDRGRPALRRADDPDRLPGMALAEEGRHCSKAAAQWALRRDPALQVIRDALRQRQRDPAARIDPAQVASWWGWFGRGLPGARDGTELRSILQDVDERLEGVAGGRLVAGRLRGRRAELVHGGGEQARVAHCKAVPEAGQPRPQRGQPSSRAPVLVVIP